MTQRALIASMGVALQRIHYSSAYTKAGQKTDPGKTIVAAAKSLAEKLGTITGALFEVLPIDPGADTGTGIVLGLGTDFGDANWASPKSWFDGDPLCREHYEIRSYVSGVRIAGASALAVQHAVWDLLYRIGYRQYFPSPTWEVIPSIPELSVEVDASESPDFLDRYYWGGHGQWEETEDRVTDWRNKNRMARGYKVSSGNGGYESIIRFNRDALAVNPDHWALVDGVRQTSGTKFCTANPGLRQIVVNDVFRRFSNPLTTSQSLEASDLPTGYCECDVTSHGGVEYPGCNQLFGTVATIGRAAITNRVVALANVAAVAMRELYPAREFLIGILAYSTHSDPPTLWVDSNVSVGFAADYNGGRNTPELMLEWMRQWSDYGSRAGALYDYWSNTDQHWDLPGAGGFARSDVFTTKILPYFQNGIRFITAEANYNWGPNGLYYWLASRVLWDTTEWTEALCADFFNACFGAGGPDTVDVARDFYALIDGCNRPVVTSRLIGSMYDLLRKGLRSTTDVAVRRRFYDLVLYTRWVELVQYRESVKGNATLNAQAFENLMRFGYRIRWSEMTHSCALWRGESDKIPVETPGVAPWQDPTHSWKSDAPLGLTYSSDEVSEIAGTTGDGTDVESILGTGIANNPVVEFSWTPRVYSPIDLIPAPAAMYQSLPAKYLNLWGTYGYMISEHSFYVWVDAPGELRVTLTSGLISPRPWTTATVSLVGESGEVVSTGSAPNDALPHEIVLTAQRPGLHKFLVKPGHRVRAKLDWPRGLRVTLNYGLDRALRQYYFNARMTQYLYVPKGTQEVGFYYTEGSNKVIESPTGVVHTFTGSVGDYATVTVPPGRAGTVWRLNNHPGLRVPLNIPQYYARHPSELLLPRAVVESDWGVGRG